MCWGQMRSRIPILRIRADDDIGGISVCCAARAGRNRCAEGKTDAFGQCQSAKWICVEAESVAVESIGDVILYVMGFDEDVSAIKDAFLALDE